MRKIRITHLTIDVLTAALFHFLSCFVRVTQQDAPIKSYPAYSSQGNAVLT